MDRTFWRNLAFVSGPWILFGAYSGAETHYRSSFGKHPYSWPSSLSAEMAYTLLWCLVTPAIWQLSRSFPLDRARASPLCVVRNFGLHMVNSVVAAVLTKALWNAIFELRGPQAGMPFSQAGFLLSLASTFTEGVSLYWAIVLAAHAYDYYRQYQTSRLQAAVLQGQLVNAQLHALKMQLHPHFLFNTLHSVTALIHEDADAADRMIARLSELLRLSLDSGGAQQVPLRQELRFLDLYLEIEKTRFDERLRVSFEIDPATEDAMVPNLVLQPLVENSIRHGISSMPSGGLIRIFSERDGARLRLRVVDNGQGLNGRESASSKAGIGLSATRGRLERLYGHEQSLLLRNVRGGGAEALITIPFLTAYKDADVPDQRSCS